MLIYLYSKSLNGCHRSGCHCYNCHHFDVHQLSFTTSDSDKGNTGKQRKSVSLPRNIYKLWLGLELLLVLELDLGLE